MRRSLFVAISVGAGLWFAGAGRLAHAQGGETRRVLAAEPVVASGAFRQQSSADAAYAASAARTHPRLLGLPPFSARLDPFNWLIRGRLNFEFEMAVWRLITVELIPTFVANSAPATFDFGGRPDPVRQASAGIGPLAGATLGVGMWFRGTPFTGYVLRFALSNVAMRFRAVDDLGEFDRVRKVERQVQMLLGSHTRLRWFTLAGDFGMAYELHHQRRCFANPGREDSAVASTGCTDDALSIRLDRQTLHVWDLNGPAHPLYFLARFSVGVVFD